MAIDLPAAFRDEWRRLDTRTDDRSLALLTVESETTLYEHVPTAEAIERPAGRGIPVRSLFTVDLTFRPGLSALGVSPRAAFAIAAARAKRQFVEMIENEGVLVAGERESVRFERADGTTGRRYVLSTAYPIDPVEDDEPEDDQSTRADSERDREAANRSVHERTIDAETHVAVWPTADAYAMAGGTLPLEEFGDATLDVDPDRDRETVLEVIRTAGLDESPSGSERGDQS